MEIPVKYRSLPLLIQCGNTKTKTKNKVWELYTQGLWQTFARFYREHDETSPLHAYVVSALHGIKSMDHVLEPYNKVMVADSRIKTKPNEIRVKDNLKILRESWGNKPKEVLFVGGKLYKEALQRAGFIVHDIHELPEFLNSKNDKGIPYKDIRAGIGTQRAALRFLLNSLQPLTKSETTIVESLPKRFAQLSLLF